MATKVTAIVDRNYDPKAVGNIGYNSKWGDLGMFIRSPYNGRSLSLSFFGGAHSANGVTVNAPAWLRIVDGYLCNISVPRYVFHRFTRPSNAKKGFCPHSQDVFVPVRASSDLTSFAVHFGTTWYKLGSGEIVSCSDFPVSDYCGTITLEPK